MTTTYKEFLSRKQQLGPTSGFDPLWIPEFLYDFQRHLVEWSIRQGRAALFADCGLGKTPMQLVWAQNVVQKTNRPVMIITPLAVAQQTKREADKFGIDAEVSRDGEYSGKIVITNYERLHYFDANDFVGAVADEASAIKAFDGRRRKEVTRFMSKMPYRLLATATPAPNDFIELGTLSECLGVMTQSDMLGFFFKETKNMRHTVFKEGDFWNWTKYTFKAHSSEPFWRWVVSWSRGCRMPSDLGFDDGAFVLPPLNQIDHIVDIPWIPAGELFPRPAITLQEQKEERLRTINERADKVAELLNTDRPVIAWCHYNEEGDALEQRIDGCVQVAGKDSLEDKEARLWDFALGNVRALVTKPKIGCWGLNLQHCGDMSFFPTFSFEGYYQGVRRCWRFGREGPVNVHVISSPGESKVIAGLRKKQENAETMFGRVVAHMNNAIVMNSEDRHTKQIKLPHFLKGTNNNGHH